MTTCSPGSAVYFYTYPASYAGVGGVVFHHESSWLYTRTFAPAGSDVPGTCASLRECLRTRILLSLYSRRASLITTLLYQHSTEQLFLLTA